MYEIEFCNWNLSTGLSTIGVEMPKNSYRNSVSFWGHAMDALGCVLVVALLSFLTIFTFCF